MKLATLAGTVMAVGILSARVAYAVSGLSLIWREPAARTSEMFSRAASDRRVAGRIHVQSADLHGPFATASLELLPYEIKARTPGSAPCGSLMDGSFSSLLYALYQGTPCKNSGVSHVPSPEKTS